MNSRIVIDMQVNLDDESSVLCRSSVLAWQYCRRARYKCLFIKMNMRLYCSLLSDVATSCGLLWFVPTEFVVTSQFSKFGYHKLEF